MSSSGRDDHKGTTGGPLDITAKDVMQPTSDRALKGGEQPELGPDDLANMDALAEVAREKNDVYMVKTDLEDEEQRSNSPGLKDQA